MEFSRRVFKFHFNSLVWLGTLSTALSCIQVPAQQPTTAPAQQLAPAGAAAPQQSTQAALQQSAPTASSGSAAQFGPTQSGPLAIVSLDSKDPASAAMVTGAL